jgi:hypothetical protein
LRRKTEGIPISPLAPLPYRKFIPVWWSKNKSIAIIILLKI